MINLLKKNMCGMMFFVVLGISMLGASILIKDVKDLYAWTHEMDVLEESILQMYWEHQRSMDYNRQLSDYIRENDLPVPAPKLLESQTWPHQSDGNSFNLQRPTSPMPNVLPLSPDGLFRRNWMEHDASGMEGLREV